MDTYSVVTLHSAEEEVVGANMGKCFPSLDVWLHLSWGSHTQCFTLRQVVSAKCSGTYQDVFDQDTHTHTRVYIGTESTWSERDFDFGKDLFGFFLTITILGFSSE